MALITTNDGSFLVFVDGVHRGAFLKLIDANWFALALLKEGLVDSVTLPSGLEIR